MDSRALKSGRLSKRNEDLYHHDYDEYDNELEYNKKLKGVASLGTLATMSSWLERQASSHQVQLAATALLSAAAVAGAIFGTQSIRRKVAIEELKASIPKVDEDHRLQKVWLPLGNLLISERDLTGGSTAHRIWHRIPHITP